MKFWKVMIFLMISLLCFAEEDYFMVVEVSKGGKEIVKDSMCYVLRKEYRSFLGNQYTIVGELTEFEENQINDLRYRLMPNDIIQISGENAEILLISKDRTIRILKSNKYNYMLLIPENNKPLELGEKTSTEELSEYKNLVINGKTYEVYDDIGVVKIKVLEGEVLLNKSNENIEKAVTGDILIWDNNKWRLEKMEIKEKEKKPLFEPKGEKVQIKIKG